MTYTQFNRTAHNHRYFIDHNSGDKICLCGLVQGVEEKKPNKYHNRSTEYNGKLYDSQFEAQHAADLDWLVKSGDVTHWDRQVTLDLRFNGYHICNYKIDFIVHYKDGHREYAETKGIQTRDWLLKWRILEATFDTFKQHPDDKMVLVQQQKSYPQRHIAKSQTLAIMK